MSKKENGNNDNVEIKKPKHEDFSKKPPAIIKENVRDNTETTGSTGPQKTNDRKEK